jgi:hypothetical protein
MSKDRDTQTDRNETGPVPDRVKTDKNWEDAVKDALTKERPKGGWPKPDKEKRRGS